MQEMSLKGAPVSPQARDLAQSPPVGKTSGNAELKTRLWAVIINDDVIVGTRSLPIQKTTRNEKRRNLKN
jgi:hypothetical protein